MTKRRMMLAFLFCFSIGGLARITGFQARSLARDSRRSTRMVRPRGRGGPQREQAMKEREKEIQKVGGIACHHAKKALGGSEERWKLIQPKLEKVQSLRDLARSTIGAGVSDGTGQGGPALKWERPWKDKPPNELTEAQRLARHLRMLLEKKDTPPQVLGRKMAALRKARRKEAEIKKQLAEARRDLREILTTREEAILMLKGWF